MNSLRPTSLVSALTALAFCSACVAIAKLPAGILSSVAQDDTDILDRRARTTREGGTKKDEGEGSMARTALPQGNLAEGLPTPAGQTPTDSLNQPTAIISSNLPGLVGRIITPDPGLVGNNSAGLIDMGSGAFFRILSVAAALRSVPVAGARVQLLDTAGAPIGGAEAISDGQGNYRIPTRDRPLEAVAVRATFESGGKAFIFETLSKLPASGQASADIDAPSTLSSAKVLHVMRRKQLAPGNLSVPNFERLRASVGNVLRPENIPYMAVDSRDVLPGFDQLALDEVDVAKAALDIAPAMVSPTRGWNVRTILSGKQANRLGFPIFGGFSNLFVLTEWGHFEVDSDGNLYLPAEIGSEGVAIFRSMKGSDGQYTALERFSTVPVQDNEVALRFSPTNLLHVALQRPDGELQVWAGGASMQKVAWCHPGSKPRYSIKYGDGRLLAIDDRGIIFLVDPATGRVLKMGKGSCESVFVAGNSGTLARDVGLAWKPGVGLMVTDGGQQVLSALPASGSAIILGGSPGQPGYKNGRGQAARFRSPKSVAVGKTGDVFVIDDLRLRRISRDGSVFLVAGSGERGVGDDKGLTATFYKPRFLSIDGSDNLYLSDLIVPPPGSLDPVEEVIRVVSPATD